MNGITKLTRLTDGKPIWLVNSHIEAVLEGDDTGSIVWLDSSYEDYVAIKESPDVVINLIKLSERRASK